MMLGWYLRRSFGWDERGWINAVRGSYGGYGRERGYVYAMLSMKEMMCYMEVGLVAGI
jgi:hypothetical protein